jgi:molecular chaperone IbpA|tara:strand:- start:3100 stop:3516 length:417 start_codon:yes stop_codon:yes gene_type:complete
MSVFHNINRYAIGFDHLMDHLVSLHSNNNLTTNEYPPYDIIKEGESNYKIELAVAGFKKDELSIQLKDNTLTIKGESNSKNSNGDYLHKNIARRSFSKNFTLAENIEVGDAEFEDGVLGVSLTHNIPEEQRPKEISIH